MRIGDLDALFCQFWGKADPFKEQTLVRPCVVWSEAATLAREAPTIDPETLPLVRQLREELARVTAEREAAVKDADNARQILLMAMFAKCEFFVKFDSFGKLVQIVRRTDEEEAHQ